MLPWKHSFCSLVLRNSSLGARSPLESFHLFSHTLPSQYYHFYLLNCKPLIFFHAPSSSSNCVLVLVQVYLPVCKILHHRRLCLIKKCSLSFTISSLSSSLLKIHSCLGMFCQLRGLTWDVNQAFSCSHIQVLHWFSGQSASQLKEMRALLCYP